jgi:hypothetical protein
MAVMKDGLIGKSLYTLPQEDWNEAKVRKNAEPYHPIRSKLWNSSVMRGKAVAKIVSAMSIENIVIFNLLTHQVESD